MLSLHKIYSISGKYTSKLDTFPLDLGYLCIRLHFCNKSYINKGRIG